MIILRLVEIKANAVVVILLLLSMVTIFISPAVDLQPTALRALQLANLLLTVLALAGHAVFARWNTSISLVAHPCEDLRIPPPPDLLKLNCARLC